MARAACVFPDDCRASNACYTSYGCRGEACARARASYKRGEQRRANRPDVVAVALRVPVGQLRSHLAMLHDAGIGYRRIAKVSGVSENTIWRVCTGRQATVSPQTRERLFGVLPSMLAPNALVPSGPTLERLGALTEAGWCAEDLARAVLGPTVRRWQGRWALARLLRQGMVTNRVADAVLVLHREEFPPARDDSNPLEGWQLSEDTIGDQSWRAEAECRRVEVGEAFFPTRGEQPTEARAICQRCPVMEPCLDFALVTNSQGIWGATTGGERRLIRRLGWTASVVFTRWAEASGEPLIRLLEAALTPVAEAV